MNKKLFVANLAYSVTEEELQSIFGESGVVESASVAMDRNTGKKRGFGFVEMATQAEAEAAIRNLNGVNLEGRPMSVAMSEPRPRGGNRF